MMMMMMMMSGMSAGLGGLFGLWHVSIPDNNFVLKACSKICLSLLKYTTQTQRNFFHHSVSHTLSYMHTKTHTHILIFYGVHAKLHLLYKVLLELDHRGWNSARQPHMMQDVEADFCIPAHLLPVQYCMRDLPSELCELYWDRNPLDGVVL